MTSADQSCLNSFLSIWWFCLVFGRIALIVKLGPWRRGGNGTGKWQGRAEVDGSGGQIQETRRNCKEKGGGEYSNLSDKTSKIHFGQWSLTTLTIPVPYLISYHSSNHLSSPFIPFLHFFLYFLFLNYFSSQSKSVFKGVSISLFAHLNLDLSSLSLTQFTNSPSQLYTIHFWWVHIPFRFHFFLLKLGKSRLWVNPFLWSTQ